jgi:hypothetical protein
MATPTNLPASFASGSTLSAATMNNLRGAFRILQVVHGTTATQVANNTTTFVDTGLTATITPQSTSSKILVYISQGMGSGGATVQEIRVMRDAVLVNTFGHVLYNDTGGLILGYPNFISFDAPASTSALIYKTQQRRVVGVNNAITQFTDANGTQRSSIILMEISA